jgi:hypothetical protein
MLTKVLIDKMPKCWDATRTCLIRGPPIGMKQMYQEPSKGKMLSSKEIRAVIKDSVIRDIELYIREMPPYLYREFTSGKPEDILRDLLFLEKVCPSFGYN